MDKENEKVTFEGEGLKIKTTVGAFTDEANKSSGNEKFLIPPDTHFEEDEFIAAPELETIAKNLIDKYESDFRHIYSANILYLWKQKGGASGGESTLGKCIRPTGLAKHFASKNLGGFRDKVDFVIWVAADHTRNCQFDVRMMAALIFHELMHTGWDDGKFIVKTHEFEGYAREIEEFGMWKNSIKKIAEACLTVKDIQQGLFN